MTKQPFNIDAERELLGSAITERPHRDIILDTISEASVFYDPRHREIFTAIQESKKPDLVYLFDKLPHHREYLTELSGLYTPEPKGACLHLLEKAAARKVLDELSSLINRSGEMDVFDLVEACYQVGDKGNEVLNQAVDATVNIGQILTSEVAKLEAAKRDKKLTGIPCGIRDIDEITSGWQNGNLVVLAARPRIGKTALMLTWAVSSGVPVAIASLEMTVRQLMQRLIANTSNIDLGRVIHKPLTGEETTKISNSAGGLESIYVNDTPNMQIHRFRSWAKKMVKQYGCKMIMADYLQLFTAGRKDGREREIADISATMKAVAKELDVPVICLSQLNRKVEDRANKRPLLSDLRESGSIEQDADMVIFIHREAVYNAEADEKEAIIEIAKHRQGNEGSFEVDFIGQHMRFQNRGELGFVPINQNGHGKEDTPF